MDDVVVGIDAGSTAVKVVAVDPATGTIRASGSASTPRTILAPGRIEVDAAAVADIACTLLRAMPVPVRAATRAIGVTGQMCTPVLVGEDGRPVAPAQSIFDNRCGPQTAALDRVAGHLLAHEGNRALSIHTLPKLMWTAAHRPGDLVEARHVVCVKDFVRAALIDEWASDPSDASGTALFDQQADRWDAELIDELGLPVRLFGTVLPSDAVAGQLTCAAAARTGLSRGVPVVTGAADMAAVGAGVGARPGDVVVSVGTAGHVIAPAADFARAAWPVQQYRYDATDRYYRFGAVFSAGLALDWLLDLFGVSWSETPLPSRRSDATTAPLFMPYLAGAGAPHYQPQAGGAFTGLRVGHGRGDLIAAVLDGIALEIAEILASVAPAATGRLVVTGGASRYTPLVEAIAAASRRPVERTKCTEAAGLGAARLATAALSDRPLEIPVPTTWCEPTAEEVGYLAQLRARYAVAAAAVRDLQPGPDKPPGMES